MSRVASGPPLDPEMDAQLAEIIDGPAEKKNQAAQDLAEVLDLLDQGRDAEALDKLGLGPKGGYRRGGRRAGR